MKVITFESPSGIVINITEEQRAELEARGTWPKDDQGHKYSIVRRALHEGEQIDADREMVERLLLQNDPNGWEAS